MMTDRLGNIVGAFANSIADAVLDAAQREVGVSGPSAAALALINHEPGITIETLHNGLGLTHAGTVRLINRLETSNLVMRKRSDSDRRAVSLFLTSDGEITCALLLASRRVILGEALSVLSAKELNSLEKIVEKLLQSSIKTLAHAYSVCRLCDGFVCEDCPVEASLEASPFI
jgi:DNA-binding MarR family transcriptional regulator